MAGTKEKSNETMFADGRLLVGWVGRSVVGRSHFIRERACH